MSENTHNGLPATSVVIKSRSMALQRYTVALFLSLSFSLSPPPSEISRFIAKIARQKVCLMAPKSRIFSSFRRRAGTRTPAFRGGEPSQSRRIIRRGMRRAIGRERVLHENEIAAFPIRAGRRGNKADEPLVAPLSAAFSLNARKRVRRRSKAVTAVAIAVVMIDPYL